MKPKSESSAPKTLTDANGNAVPIKYVSKYDRLRDAKARRILARWTAERARLEAVMRDTLADIGELMIARMAETGAPPADKGNFRAASFDGSICVELRQSYRIYLDDRVAEAKRIMLEWALGLTSSLADGTAKEVLARLIEEAFSANQSGSLPVGKILSLLRIDIAAPEWLRARNLLQDAIKPERGKCYIAVSSRSDRQHDYAPIRLDIADCWPEPACSSGAVPPEEEPAQ